MTISDNPGPRISSWQPHSRTIGMLKSVLFCQSSKKVPSWIPFPVSFHC